MTATSTRLRIEQGAPTARDLLAFLALLFSGLALGFGLWWLSGPPPIPSSAPDLDRLARTLTSPDVPYDDVIYLARVIGWLALAYLGSTVALRILVNAVSRLTDGASWSQAAMGLSDLLTLPVVRRLVDAAIVGVVVLSIWLRARPGLAAEATPASVDPVTLDLQTPRAGYWIASPPPLDFGIEAALPVQQQYVPYTVVQGDNLWSIARRFYGDGARYPLIFEANQGRMMTTGQQFDDPRLIRPDWVLDVPLPAYNVAAEGAHVTYRVQSGDSLWCIAEGMLGDGFRWIEIWQMNQGRSMMDGRAFVDPDLIYPGWVLDLPIEVKTEAIEAPVEPAVTAPSPTPEVESPTPTPEPAVPTVAPIGEVEPSPEPTSAPHEPEDGTSGIDLPLPSGGQMLAGAAALVLAGGAVLAVRTLVRRAHGGGPRAVGARKERKRPHGDAGKVVLAGQSLLSRLAELGFDDLRVVSAREMERYIEFLVECAPGDAEAVVRTRYDLSRRLACRVDGEVDDSTHVLMKLSSFQRLAGLLTGGAREELLLVPVGAAGGVHYLNLAAAGGTLVAGEPHETSQVVSAWKATLSATHRPEEVAVLLGSDVAGETMETSGPVEETQGWPFDQLASELREALVAREAEVNPAGAMPLVAILGASQVWETEALDIETLLRRGPAQSIHIVVVAGDALGSDSLRPFGARVVFGGLLRSEGDEEPRYADADEIVLSIGHREAVALQPIAVRAEVMPPARPLQEHDLEEEWPTGPWAPPAEDAEWEEAEPETRTEEALPDESHLWQQPAEVDAVQAADTETDEQPSPRVEPEPPESDEGDTRLPDEPSRDIDEEASVAAPLFRVQCFGTFDVTNAAGEPLHWTIRKARELMAYLVTHRGRSVPREEVAEALWPEEAPEQVDRLLSNAAYQLRRAFKTSVEADVQILSTVSQRYHLQPELLRVDVDAFNAHLQRADKLEGQEALDEYQRALAIYRDDFLARDPFSWPTPYRQEYQSRFVAAAHRGARLAIECRDEVRAVEFYGAILRRDPVDEEAARGLMRCYGKLGDSGGVRKVYRILRESLRRELDDDKAEPLRETKALYEELVRAKDS